MGQGGQGVGSGVESLQRWQARSGACFTGACTAPFMRATRCPSATRPWMQGGTVTAEPAHSSGGTACRHKPHTCGKKQNGVTGPLTDPGHNPKGVIAKCGSWCEAGGWRQTLLPALVERWVRRPHPGLGDWSCAARESCTWPPGTQLRG